MPKIREDIVHYAVRQYLKQKGFSLIAGQYPNGSDDELSALNIMDLELARDNSPDHRRHSMNKIVPDIVAYKSSFLLFIELKPTYSSADELKLTNLLRKRRRDLEIALRAFRPLKSFPVGVDELLASEFVPSLGFGFSSRFPYNEQFCYFLVKDVNTVSHKARSDELSRLFLETGRI